MPTQEAIHQDTCECLKWDAEDFTCARCDKLYGACYGAADKHPDLCDFCFGEVEKGREEVIFPKGTPRFSLGQTVMTQGMQAVLEQHPEGEGLQELGDIILKRHAQGDWGDLDQHDIDANEQALKSGGRLFSVYYLKDGTEKGTKIYVITEADKSCTTALLPSEY